MERMVAQARASAEVSLPRCVVGSMKSLVRDYEARLTVRGEEPAFNEDGVDLTQIRRALALTRLERLIGAEKAAMEVEALRRLAHVKRGPGGEH